MRVVVFGGTGYVGGHIVDALRDGKNEVIVVSRNASDATLPSGVNAFGGDLKEPPSYEAALKDAQGVVHAVGLIRNRRSRGQTFRRVVEKGTKDLVAACRKHGVKRFVLVSANDTKQQGTDYQETKWSAEQAVKNSGMTYTIFRPSLIFGSDDRFTTTMRKLMRLGAIPYFGKGDYPMAPVHADDVARVVAASLTNPKAADRLFHVCGPETVTYQQMLRGIKAASGSHALVLPMPKFVIRTAAYLLGWMPAFPATNEALTMLFEGNACEEHEWTKVFGVKPKPFSAGIREYLGKGGSAKRINQMGRSKR